MTKLNFPCPCGGHIKWRKEKVIQDGIDCGIIEVEVCEKCSEVYLPEESMRIVEKKLKEAGLWGTERKQVKLWKSGNSVTIRLPTSLTKELHLNSIKTATIHQEGKNKLAIEF